MKTAIIYTSRYGSTKKVAEKIASLLKAELIFSTNDDIADLNSIDNIVLGIPIYAGTTTRDMRTFLKKNWDDIRLKITGVFVMCWDEERLYDFLNTILPGKLTDIALVKCLGSEINPELLLEFEKKVIFELIGITENTSNISEEKIVEFANEISNRN